MIDTRELRIGNLVRVPHGAVQIAHFTKEGAHFTDGNGGNWQSLYPIPLTPRVLYACGFDTLDNEQDFIDWGGLPGDPNGDRFSIVQDGFPAQEQPFVFRYDVGLSENNMEVKWLHQLQNLYFALTGEDLEVKL